MDEERPNERRGFRFFVRVPADQRQTIHKEIEEGSSPFIRYWVMVALSTTIAAYGLLSNSAAVIIGAMLVAPLMGPIFGIALGLVSGDNSLLRKAMISEFLGVAFAIGIGWIVGALPLNLGVSAEMLSRTSPNLYDLLIALASGLAGAYACVNPRISNALPGVAISVALVPPLSTCGLFIARGEYSLGSGAFLLFAANFFAIQIAASGLFILHDMEGHREIRKLGLARFLIRFAPSLLATLAMGVFMTRTLREIYAERMLDHELRDVLTSEIRLRTGGTLEQILDRRMDGEVLSVVAVALTPQAFEPNQVTSIESALAKAVGRPVSLIVRSLISKDSDRKGQVYYTREEREASVQLGEERRVLGDATATLRAGLASVSGANLESLARTESEGVATFTAVVRTPTAVPPELVAELEAQIGRRLGRTVRLLVRSVLTRDADSQRFIYDPEPEQAPPLAPAAAALRNRVSDVVSRRVSAFPGARLIESTFVVEGAGTRVDATVEAPQPILPEDVGPIESDLRKYVDPKLTLRVRTRVVGVASAQGWVFDSSGG